MKIDTLELFNFKGVEHLTISLGGRNCVISGRNATGKTTVADAYNWLLFGKDSTGREKFDLKPLKPDGEPIHGLEHSVRAVFLIPYASGRVELKRTLREVWTKKRGTTDPQLTNHETEYTINGVPSTATEFEREVSNLMPPARLRILSDPGHFCKTLPWEKRREILYGFVGALTDDEIIASNPALAGLPAILDGKTVEQAERVIKARIATIKEQLDRIPARIDEVTRRIKRPALARAAIEQEIQTLTAELESLEQQSSSAAAQAKAEGDAVAMLRGDLRAAEANRANLIDAAGADIRQRENAARMDRNIAQSAIDLATRAALDAEAAITSERQRVDKLKADIEGYRAKWREADNATFDMRATDTHCPTCGRELENAEAIIAEARAAFHARNDKAKAAAVDSANFAKGRLADSEAFIAKQQAAADEARERARKSQEAWAEADATVKTIELEKGVARIVPGVAEYDAEIARIREALAVRPGFDSGNLAEDMKQRRAALDERRGWLKDHERAAEDDARVEELKADQRQQADELAALERAMSLIALFISAKMALVEDKVNGLFGKIKFRLFKQQINGGIAECCDALINGVPYDSANNAAKINAGVEIINVLGRYWGISAPVFIDNAEAVNEVVDTDAQTLQLTVTTAPNLNVIVA